MNILQDIFLPTADACRLLGHPRADTRILNRLKIPFKKDFTTKLWSRNAIYAELKRRRQASHPPPCFLTLSEVAETLKRSTSYTHHLLTKHKIPPTKIPLFRNNLYRITPVYHKQQINKLIKELQFAKNSFPPEGWLEIQDCTSYLARTPQAVRYLCRKHNIRIKKLHTSKYLYNEDDIIRLRKYLHNRRRRIAKQKPQT